MNDETVCAIIWTIGVLVISVIMTCVAMRDGEKVEKSPPSVNY